MCGGKGRNRDIIVISKRPVLGRLEERQTVMDDGRFASDAEGLQERRTKFRAATVHSAFDRLFSP
jgi:hypothetical protein